MRFCSEPLTQRSWNQIPPWRENPKSQIPNNSQSPNDQNPKQIRWSFEIGIWILFVIWYLEIGASGKMGWERGAQVKPEPLSSQ
jgi:hypothetical protein